MTPDHVTESVEKRINVSWPKKVFSAHKGSSQSSWETPVGKNYTELSEVFAPIQMDLFIPSAGTVCSSCGPGWLQPCWGRAWSSQRAGACGRQQPGHTRQQRCQAGTGETESRKKLVLAFPSTSPGQCWRNESGLAGQLSFTTNASWWPFSSTNAAAGLLLLS